MSIAGLSTGKLVSKFKRELRSSQVKSSEIALSRSSQLEKLNLKALFPGIIRYHAQFRGRGTAHSLVERVCTAVSEHTSLHALFALAARLSFNLMWLALWVWLSRARAPSPPGPVHTAPHNVLMIVLVDFHACPAASPPSLLA